MNWYAYQCPDCEREMFYWQAESLPGLGESMPLPVFLPNGKEPKYGEDMECYYCQYPHTGCLIMQAIVRVDKPHFIKRDEKMHRGENLIKRYVELSNSISQLEKDKTAVTNKLDNAKTAHHAVLEEMAKLVGQNVRRRAFEFEGYAYLVEYAGDGIVTEPVRVTKLEVEHL